MICCVKIVKNDNSVWQIAFPYLFLFFNRAVENSDTFYRLTVLFSYMNNETFEQLNSLALEILKLSRNTLLVNFRFLDIALCRFEYIRSDAPIIATDGEHLIYNPVSVLKEYKSESEMSVRTYLHMVLHCVFRHLFVGQNIKEDYWNLACDITVEYLINELNLPKTKVGRVGGQKDFIRKLQNNVDLITAEKVYAHLTKNITENELRKIQPLFYCDNHDIWYASDEDGSNRFTDGSDDDNSDNQLNNQLNRQKSQDEEQNDDDSENQNSEYGESESSSRKDRLEKQWQDISKRVQTDLETFSKDRGDEAGGMMQNLKSLNREKYDYTEFLKRFAVLGETMKINDDEFDYVFYTYGLQLYKNMPLIEPLEYKEVKKIKEFVIAIDTSGSVSGDLVQTFLRKTYNILKSSESFFEQVNIHIIQCDSVIQKDHKITNEEEFDDYIGKMVLKGFGGTDFRPVFDYVDSLKDFNNLKGLIYFTDGWGGFSRQKTVL